MRYSSWLHVAYTKGGIGVPSSLVGCPESTRIAISPNLMCTHSSRFCRKASSVSGLPSHHRLLDFVLRPLRILFSTATMLSSMTLHCSGDAEAGGSDEGSVSGVYVPGDGLTPGEASP
eukprot:scaffold32041_cov63-Phaeocystis_antarctica.AAC.2